MSADGYFHLAGLTTLILSVPGSAHRAGWRDISHSSRNLPEPGELRRVARVYVWGRWFVLSIATFAWLYPLNVDEVVHVPNAALAMLLLATNGYLHYRLATERTVSWRWMLALSALDLAMLSGRVAAHRGFESPFFVGYYPSLAMFAVVFGSVRLTLVWVTMAAVVYAALCLAVEPGLDFSANDEEILLIRVAGMYLVVVVVNLISRVERTRRMEALERERALQRERIELSHAIHNTTPNSPATGAPTISGTAQVGETFTVDMSGVSDADELENASFSYQWLAGDAEIAEATSSSYTLAETEDGKTVKVRVSFTDDRGNDETLTSEATAAVAPAPSGEEDPQDGAEQHVPVWPATMTVEWVYQGYGYYSTATKKAGSLSPASFEVDGTTYTVTMTEANGWSIYIGLDKELPFDFALEMDGSRFASSDASFNSYSYGNIYRWRPANLSWKDGDTVKVRMLRAVEDEEAANSPATGGPTISGTAQVGETLTADTSGIRADQDGLDNAAFTYQWLADDAEIAGATGYTYTLADTDEGKAVKVRVSFTDDADNEETLTSAATAAVAAKPDSLATGAPTISGTA